MVSIIGKSKDYEKIFVHNSFEKRLKSKVYKAFETFKKKNPITKCKNR